MFLPCHILGGWIYRKRERRLYGQDVLRFESMLHLKISATDFEHSVFACCGQKEGGLRCLFSCFCAPIRLAADSSAVGFIPFWVALVLYSIFVPFLAVFGFVQRLHMREEYHMQKNFMGDCLAWFCCYCMPLVQEGKFVDRAFVSMRDEGYFIQQSDYVPAVRSRVRCIYE